LVTFAGLSVRAGRNCRADRRRQCSL